MRLHVAGIADFVAQNLQVLQEFGHEPDPHLAPVDERWRTSNGGCVAARMKSVVASMNCTFVKQAQSTLMLLFLCTGHVIEWDNRVAQFATIRGAGHLVPANRPTVALSMLQHFLADKPFPEYVAPPSVEL